MGERDPRVLDYIRAAEPFAQPILEHLRSLWHEACPHIRETIKWGAPHFTNRSIVGAMAGFKAHVAMGFWNRRNMKDPQGLFKDTDRTHLSAIKVGSLEELPPDEVLRAYMREAFDLDVRGVKPSRGPQPDRPLDVPGDLEDALATSPVAGQTFNDFSWSNRRDYVEWITGAKLPATRARRLAQAIEWLEEGKPRNWKYLKR